MVHGPVLEQTAWKRLTQGVQKAGLLSLCHAFPWHHVPLWQEHPHVKTPQATYPHLCGAEAPLCALECQTACCLHERSFLWTPTISKAHVHLIN